jgi:tetratricopeptide (TPR) repeat protein
LERSRTRELHRALELNPTSAGVLTIYSFYYLLPLKRFDEAIAMSRKALDLDPLSPLMHGNLGSIYTFCRQWDRALEEFNNALEIDPHSGPSYYRLAYMHFSSGNYDKAISTAEAAIREMGRLPTLPLLGAVYARAGRITEAQKILEELQDTDQKMYIPPVYLAILYSALAMTDQALDCYERAVEDGSLVTILSVAFDRINEPLRSHPRFISLLRKMNLEP